MRTFELVLILVNLFSLALGFTKQSKAGWLKITAVNLIVLFVHGLFEGFRYQMGFSYLFVLLLALLTLAKTKDRLYRSRIPNVLKAITIGVSFVPLAFTAFLASAFPVFRLPKPTGSYAVGIQYFHFVDKNRSDPFLEPSTKNRELMVKVYYPATKDGSKPFDRYFHNSPALIKLLAEFYNMPEALFEHLTLVKTNSKEGILLSEEQPSYPIVLFSHGAGTTMEVQTAQSEDLASHGYIVVAIDHTYVSMGTVFPNRIVSHKEATADFNTPEPAEIITQIMTDDAKFVMDQLAEMNEGKIVSMFQGRLDLNRIGVIGHSVGGAVAYNLAINDSRVKAAINLDGRVYITPKGNPNDMAPFLMLASDGIHSQTLQGRKSLMPKFADMTEEEQSILLSMYGSRDAYDQAYDKDSRNVMGLTEVLNASGNLFTIEGSDHMKFTDIGLFIGVHELRELIGIRGKTDPARCLEISNTLTLAFFDRHLKEDGKVSVEDLITKHPELKRVPLPYLSPAPRR